MYKNANTQTYKSINVQKNTETQKDQTQMYKHSFTKTYKRTKM